MKKLFILCLALLLIILPACGNDTPPAENPSGDIPNDSNQEYTSEIPDLPFNPASDFEYTKNGNGTVTITKYIGKSANVVIPEEIEGLPVTEITGLIPIVDNDFIKIVIFPSNVKSIDHRAIHSACSVEEVYVREGTQEIQNGAFKLVSTLTKIVLPDSLKKFGFSVFYGCTSLKHIKIPSKISVLSQGLFEESGLETIELSEGLETIELMAFYKSNLKSIVLPKTVKFIDIQAFDRCKELESVTLNEGLETIEYRAFYNTPELKSIVIPSTVKSVTEYAFGHDLKEIKFAGDAPETFIYSDIIAGEVRHIINDYCVIYYHEDAKGFTSPTWYGYQTAIW